MSPAEKIWTRITLKVTLLILFPLMSHSQSTLKISDDPSPVEARLGQDVTIPCVLTDTNEPQRVLDLNMRTAGVRWEMRLKGSEQRVGLFTNGNYEPTRPDSNIDWEDFRRGDASLTLHNVQGSDEGEYICTMFESGVKFEAVRTVEVSVRPVVTLSSYDVTIELGSERSVTCYVDKFYPDSVRILWEKHNASSNVPLDRDICISASRQDNDGTFNVTSTILVKPFSTQETGDKYYCIVYHRSLKKEHSESFTVTVSDPPEGVNLALIIVGAIVGTVVILVLPFIYIFFKKKAELSPIEVNDYVIHKRKSRFFFRISDIGYFELKIITVNVYLLRVGADKKQLICSLGHHQQCVEDESGEDGLPLTQVQAVKVNNMEAELKPEKPKRSGFLYSCQYILNITPNMGKDDGATLTIEVKGTKTPLSEHCKLNVIGDCLKVYPIEDSNKIPIKGPKYLKPGESVTLICRMKKWTPGGVNIVWQKKDLTKKKPTKFIFEEGILDQRYTHTQEVHKDGRVSTYFSSLTFTADVSEDHEKIYICQALHPALFESMTSTLKTCVTAEPEKKHPVGEERSPVTSSHSIYQN